MICICGSYMKRLYKLSFVYLPTGEYVQELRHYHQSPENLSIKYSKTQQHKDMWDGNFWSYKLVCDDGNTTENTRTYGKYRLRYSDSKTEPKGNKLWVSKGCLECFLRLTRYD